MCSIWSCFTVLSPISICTLQSLCSCSIGSEVSHVSHSIRIHVRLRHFNALTKWASVMCKHDKNGIIEQTWLETVLQRGTLLCCWLLANWSCVWHFCTQLTKAYMAKTPYNQLSLIDSVTYMLVKINQQKKLKRLYNDECYRWQFSIFYWLSYFIVSVY